MYGIYPEDYETRDEYNEALADQMKFESETSEYDDYYFEPVFSDASLDTINDSFLYCRVSRLDNGVNAFYLIGGYNVKVADKVIVPTENGTAEGIVIAVTKHSPDNQTTYETILGVSDN